MDPSHLLHIVWLLLLSVLGFFSKRALSQLETLKSELADHKLEDTKQFATLSTKSDEVARRLDQIDGKLDRLLERTK